MKFLVTCITAVLLGITWNAGMVDGSVCWTHGYNWAAWSRCSMTCGGGFRTRHCYADNTRDDERCGDICYNGAYFAGDRCHCPPGTAGVCCDDILECNSNPCKNGATCIERVNGFDCACPPGTTGLYCDDIPECLSNPCKNGGTCHEHINYFTCNCVYGTTGPYCDDIPDCASNPCKNGGTCVEHVGGYTCLCPPGTTNTNCDDILECLSSPCQNGGVCNEMINFYTCTCNIRYTGYNCQFDLLWYHDNVCRDGGSCYIIFQNALAWDDAKKFCEARNGHLLIPNDLTEQLYIENYLQRMRDRFSEELFWIGGTKSYSNSPRWVADDKISVFRWPSGVPDDIPGTQCLLVDGQYNFEWQTRPCDRKTYFICEEKVPFQLVGK